MPGPAPRGGGAGEAAAQPGAAHRPASAVRVRVGFPITTAARRRERAHPEALKPATDRARPDENLELSSVRDPDHHETAHAPVRGAAPWIRTADAPMACSVFSPSFEVRSVPRYRLTF